MTELSMVLWEKFTKEAINTGINIPNDTKFKFKPLSEVLGCNYMSPMIEPYESTKSNQDLDQFMKQMLKT